MTPSTWQLRRCVQSRAHRDPEDALPDPERECICRKVRSHRQIGVPRPPSRRERSPSRAHPAQLRVSLQRVSPTPRPVPRDPGSGGHNPARSRVDLRRPSPTSTPPFRPGTPTRPIGRADSRGTHSQRERQIEFSDTTGCSRSASRQLAMCTPVRRRGEALLLDVSLRNYVFIALARAVLASR